MACETAIWGYYENNYTKMRSRHSKSIFLVYVLEGMHGLRSNSLRSNERKLFTA